MKKFLTAFAAIATGFAAQANQAKLASPVAELPQAGSSPEAREISANTPDTKFTFDDGTGNNQVFILRRSDAGELLAQHYSHSSHSSHRSHSSHYSSR